MNIFIVGFTTYYISLWFITVCLLRNTVVAVYYYIYNEKNVLYLYIFYNNTQQKNNTIKHVLYSFIKLISYYVEYSFVIIEKKIDIY